MNSLRDKKAAFLLAVRIAALPALGFGVLGFTACAERVAPNFGPLKVIEKRANPPRYRIFARSDPNENGGTIGYDAEYPKWFYDKAAVGDTLVSGFGHFRLVRDGCWIALYIPLGMFPAAFLPLAWCLPVLSWLPRPKVLHSWLLVTLAAVIEISLVTLLMWVVLRRFCA